MQRGSHSAPCPTVRSKVPPPMDGTLGPAIPAPRSHRTHIPSSRALSGADHSFNSLIHPRLGVVAAGLRAMQRPIPRDAAKQPNQPTNQPTYLPTCVALTDTATDAGPCSTLERLPLFQKDSRRIRHSMRAPRRFIADTSRRSPPRSHLLMRRGDSAFDSLEIRGPCARSTG
jgi:hypothetical protein